MRAFRILAVIFITITLYGLIGLVSIHYMTINGYYFVPELSLFNLNRNDVVGAIEIIDLIEILLAIVLTIASYFICFKIYINKSYKPILAIMSNLLLVLIGIVYLLYWETDFFHIERPSQYGIHIGKTYIDYYDSSYDIFKLFVFHCILTSVLLNSHFFSSIVSTRRKYNYLLLTFIPISSLLFLIFGSFLNSKRVIWVRIGDMEKRYNHKDFLNLHLEENTPIWYKGIEKWITYGEFKLGTPLSLIK